MLVKCVLVLVTRLKDWMHVRNILLVILIVVGHIFTILAHKVVPESWICFERVVFIFINFVLGFLLTALFV